MAMSTSAASRWLSGAAVVLTMTVTALVSQSTTTLADAAVAGQAMASPSRSLGRMIRMVPLPEWSCGCYAGMCTKPVGTDYPFCDSIIHFPPQIRCRIELDWRRRMVRQPLPASLRRAIERLEAEPERPWRLDDLAATCGVSARTLQKHFRRFLGQAARGFLQELRFNRARQALLAGGRQVSVTDVATRCGFAHLGRFAAGYLRRFSESPSTTLRRCQRTSQQTTRLPFVLTTVLERPTIAVLPFEHVGLQGGVLRAFVDEIGVALWRLHWLKVTEPRHARYPLPGRARGDSEG